MYLTQGARLATIPAWSGNFFLQTVHWAGVTFDTIALVGGVWKALLFVGPWLVVPAVMLLLLFAHWPQVRRRLGGPSFMVHPLGGDTLLWARDPQTLAERRVTARLLVRNTTRRILEKCSVRLVDAFLIHAGQILKWMHPSIMSARGESFLLRWADSESATPDRKYLNIPADDAEHIVEVFVLNVPKRYAEFAAANPADLKNKLHGITGGWWKLRIKIAAEDGTYEDTCWVAACGNDPGPITLDHWHPRGETILELQRKRDQATSSA